ncbi:MAG: heme NO-binding domain-containing protein [Gammaproteobacteria bacterium]|jgi:predicted hydrocarbon binding protein
MYGVIFHFLRNYVIEKHGGIETWRALLSANGHKIDNYNPITEYPDSDVIALAKTASEALNMPFAAVLEDFGAYTGKQLVTFYNMYVKTGWKTFDVIENAGSNIHRALNQYNKTRKPPHIDAKRVSDDQMLIHYYSQRKLCPVLKGIIKGLGEHYEESFIIKETECMHAGHPHCTITVQKIS